MAGKKKGIRKSPGKKAAGRKAAAKKGTAKKASSKSVSGKTKAKPSHAGEKSRQSPKGTARKPVRLSLEMLELREALVVRRNELLSGVQIGIQDSGASFSTKAKDTSDIAADSHDGDIAVALAEYGAGAVVQIEGAIAKIDAGTYGRCGACGRKIPLGRLKMLPFATQCVRCKEMEEAGTLPRGPAPVGGWSAVEELEKIRREEEET